MSSLFFGTVWINASGCSLALQRPGASCCCGCSDKALPWGIPIDTQISNVAAAEFSNFGPCLAELPCKRAEFSRGTSHTLCSLQAYLKTETMLFSEHACVRTHAANAQPSRSKSAEKFRFSPLPCSRDVPKPTRTTQLTDRIRLYGFAMLMTSARATPAQSERKRQDCSRCMPTHRVCI